MRAGLGVQRLCEHGGEVAAGVAVGVLDLEPEPDGAVLAHQGRRGAGQQRAEQDRAVAVRELQRSGGGGDELAQRDEVGLAGQALEGAGDEDRRRAASLPWQAL